MLRHLPKLRVLVLYNIQIQHFPSWFANLPVKELYVNSRHLVVIMRTLLLYHLRTRASYFRLG